MLTPLVALLRSIRLMCCGHRAIALENLALRQQVAALKRTVNRLKLGVFGANVSNGCAATTAPGHLEMTWPNSRDIVETADRAGFEALVPVARW